MYKRQPLYVLGLMGVTRRVNHFEDMSLQIWFQVAAFGAFLIAIGIADVYKRQFQLRFEREEHPWKHQHAGASEYFD